MALADWFTPSTSPCRVGSLRREISEFTDGTMKENPVMATTKVPMRRANKTPKLGGS